MKIGFIGLGRMGHHVASNLLKAGHSVTVWNRSQEPVAALVAKGAVAGRSPQDALQGDAVLWILKGHGGQEARMFLSNSNLRATLDVFAIQYRSMKWARTAFPEWLTEADLDPAPAGRALH